MSAIDNQKMLNFLNKANFFFKGRLLLFYIYYFYTLKIKIILLSTYSNKNVNRVVSLDKLFKSASWLERETSEMFGVFYEFKTDTRCLLLDYSKQENPLLKDFPVEGFNDVFYNFFEDQVVYNNSTVVEL